MKLLSTLDLNQNAIKNALLHPLSSAPDGGQKGQVYFNETDNRLYEYNGTAWVGIATLTDLGGYVPTSRTINGKPLTEDVTLTSEDIGVSSGVQSDWNQTDEAAADYVKNRTHYKETVAFIEEQTFTPVAEGAEITAVAVPSVGIQVTVVFDGEAYQRVPVEFSGLTSIGNLALLFMDTEDTGEPFLVGVIEQGGVVMAMCVCADNTTDHTVKVEGDVFHKLPTAYYNKTHKLYIDPNTKVYLTHDAYGQTKVTKEELRSIVDRDPIMLSLLDYKYYTPLVVGTIDDLPYGVVLYYDGDYFTLYTAEVKSTEETT